MTQTDNSLKAKLTSALQSGRVQTIVGDLGVSGNQADSIHPRYGNSKSYDRQFSSLIRQYKRSGLEPDGSLKGWLEFCDWLIKTKCPVVSPASWMAYRSAVASLLPQQEIVNRISVAPINKKSDVEKKNSAKRVKSLKISDYSKIRKHLSNSRSKYAPILNALLFVIRNTGIRPSEILGSDVIKYDKYQLMKVKTAKRDNHSFAGEIISNPYPFRYIPLVHLSDEEIQQIRTTVSAFSGVDSIESFEPLYESMRVLFYNTIGAIGLRDTDKSYSLYSARQQFSADLKATTMSTQLRTMIIGHKEDKTMRHHYARKSDGVQLFLPNPELEKQLLNAFEQQV